MEVDLKAILAFYQREHANTIARLAAETAKGEMLAAEVKRLAAEVEDLKTAAHGPSD